MSFILPSLLVLVMIMATSLDSEAQINGENLDILNYSTPKEYEIGGITVTGTKHLDKKVLIMLSGLSVGDKITLPGDQTGAAIKKLWKQGLFSDIDISATRIQGDLVFLNLHFEERPRLSKFSFLKIKKGEADDLREKIKLSKGKVLTEHLKITTRAKVLDYYLDKGYLNATVVLSQKADTSLKNSVILIISIDKQEKVKINEIKVSGNNAFTDKKVRRMMKDTKQKTPYNIFASSKFLEESYEADKRRVIEKYNDKGYRDAKIVSDTIYDHDEKTINIELTISEGNKYYIRNITWTGNTKYTAKQLNEILAIQKGDVFNQTTLNTHLYMNPKGRDISSLYLDDGYLFFSITPIETNIEGDSIDMEMQIYEGKQARINKITITGNTKTNDHVIMREIRTKPGQLFSRADIIRSQRELAQLGYFDPEKLDVRPVPNPTDGTVDIEYVLVEKSSDQIELSGGWGGFGGVVGSLGVIFTNFSAKSMFKKGTWRPLPAGDGQRLSIRAQSNGTWYQSYNFSFTEPWLGGKKPRSFSISAYTSIRTNGIKKNEAGRAHFKTTGASVGLGVRLKKPDDFFTLFTQLSYQNYNLSNWSSTFAFSDGTSNTLSGTVTFARNSIDQPIYPRSGANISLTTQATLPHSLFDGIDDYSGKSAEEIFAWNEFHKWNFKLSWYTRLVENLVLNTRVQFGFLGRYNNKLDVTPFERFSLGGSGLSGFTLYGTQVVALRGYPDNSLSPTANGGSTIYNKFTFEMRYPLSLNPSATIYGLAFLEAGNAWNEIDNFEPFNVRRSAGLGVRIFLPMFGLLGFDYGYGFDLEDVPGYGALSSKWQPHFIIVYSVE